MEQLIASSSGGLQVAQSPGRLIEVAMLARKIKLRLSREQLAVIGKLMGSYLSGANLYGLDEKVIYFLVWEIYEGKFRKKMLELKPQISITLDLPHAWALMNMLFLIDLSAWPYEKTIANLIIGEIDNQTA